MGSAKLALYIVGLIIVVGAAWVFLTQTPIADDVPPGVALAIILLLVGVGVMASARAMDDTYTTRRRVTRDAEGPLHGTAPPPGYTPGDVAETTTIEERRF